MNDTVKIIKNVFLMGLLSMPATFAGMAGLPVTPAAGPQTQRAVELAEDAAQGEKRIALVVGNAAYERGRLRNAVNDARSIAQELRGLGFQVLAFEDASQKTFKRAVRDFGEALRAAGKGAVGLFYYSGHGIQASGKNYLIPIDAEIEKETDTAIESVDVDTVLEQMDAAGGRVNIVILDACRNNPFTRSFRSGNEGLAFTNAPSGTLIAYATAPGKTASDGEGQNGLYTAELLKAIRQSGLSAEGVFKRTGAEVERQSQGKQSPWLSSSLRGEFSFAGKAKVVTGGPVDPVTVDLEYWNAIKNSTNPKDIRAYLEEFPNGKFRRLAQNRLDDLTASNARPANSGPAKQFTNQLGMEFALVPEGSFDMGSTNGSDDEKPVHRVTISRAFYLGKYEVTQGQWKAVMGGNNPSYFKGDDLPVEQVSWDDIQEFLKRLNARNDGNRYRLPSEAEWEYACRAGTTTPFSFGETITTDQVNYDGNYPYGGGPKGVYRQKTTTVGSFSANVWGLHDMHGNVWEWCEDVWHDNYNGAPTDGSAWTQGGEQSRRVLRGGSWGYGSVNCQSAIRDRSSPAYRLNDLGFRVMIAPRAQG